MKYRSEMNLKGSENSISRSLYKSMGYSDDELCDRPIIGIANSWNTIVPGHYNLKEVSEFVKKGIYRNGGTAVEFGVIAACDGIANGHPGRRCSGRQCGRDPIRRPQRGSWYAGNVQSHEIPLRNGTE